MHKHLNLQHPHKKCKAGNEHCTLHVRLHHNLQNASKGESEKSTKTPHYNRQCNKSVLWTAAEY